MGVSTFRLAHSSRTRPTWPVLLLACWGRGQGEGAPEKKSRGSVGYQSLDIVNHRLAVYPVREVADGATAGRSADFSRRLREFPCRSGGVAEGPGLAAPRFGLCRRRDLS